MVTIKDVGKHAGVSVATVSRYLNKGYVSEEAKQVIEKAIKELDYKPNQLARSLSTKKTDIIGLLVPDITNPFFPELARAVEDTAFAHGYTVVLCNSGEQKEKEIHYIESLQQKYAAGFIVTTNRLEADYYRNIELPIVALDRRLDPSIPTVTTNNVEGAKIATEYLIARGCKHILCMRGPVGLDVAEDRMTGFAETMKLHPDIQADSITSQFEFEEAEQKAFDFLKTHETVDGIFASSDASAIGAMKAAQSLGIPIPGELQIVGFDGISIGKLLTPELTTVAQDIYKLGTVATGLLIQKIENQSIENNLIELPTTLVVRSSTK
ncbi:LacI family DNA-binding transcriptional regulator [Rummeliibacillus sp. JY-2-4R]